MTTVPALTDEAALAQYVATGGQTDFNFSYMIFATADIEVYVNGVLKTETTDYTVKKSNGTSISASDLPLDGGKVVFVSGLTADDEVSLNRNIAIARLTGYSVAGAFRADVVNAEFTKALAISQQLRRDIERSVRLAAFDAEGGSLVIPTNRASKLLGFDADGDIGLFAGIADQEVLISAFMATLVDDQDASSALSTLGISTFIKTLLDDTSASAARSTLGLVIGTNVQAYNAILGYLAGLIDTAGKVPTFTGSGMTLSDAVSPASLSDIRTGTDNIKVVTPKGLADSILNSKTNNGYTYLPNGLILQWGEGIVQTSVGSTQTINFPVTFPTSCLQCVVSTRETGSNDDAWWNMTSFNASGVSVLQQATNTSAHNIKPTFFAVGY